MNSLSEKTSFVFLFKTEFLLCKNLKAMFANFSFAKPAKSTLRPQDSQRKRAVLLLNDVASRIAPFQGFDWLSGAREIVTIKLSSGCSSKAKFLVVFNKRIIPLALVGY